MRSRGITVTLALAATLVVTSVLSPISGAAATATCADPSHPGGDWPSLNGDAANTRNQPDSRIGPLEAPRLRPAWSFDAASVGSENGMRSTPIVANGCVYLALGQGYLGDSGDVVALNADTGQLVWHQRLDGSVLGLAADHGRIYAAVSKGSRGEPAMPVVNEDFRPEGSYAMAFDARTGRRAWTSARLDDGDPGNGKFIDATPVAFTVGGRSIVFVPLSGGGGDGARVPMYFLDARTGAAMTKSYSLTDAEYDAGFGGTSIWSTAAFDPAGAHLYVGTADSDGLNRQHPYNNALLKIDADPRRATFGSVVSAYSGTTEHADLDAVIGYPNNPLCGATGGLTGVDAPTFVDTSASAECLELDFDFGASPNLYRDSDGGLRVGALQKSGIFHSVDTTTMTADWRRFLGPGGAASNAGTATVSGGALVVGATPNLLFRLDRSSGQVRWVSTTGVDVFAYQPVSSAREVLYVINDIGSLLAYDARTGLPLLHRSIARDGGLPQCLGAGAGVAVARNTVFAPCDAGGPSDFAGLETTPGGLVAYRVR